VVLHEVGCEHATGEDQREQQRRESMDRAAQRCNTAPGEQDEDR
jgi:hypothetical protein